MTSQNENNGKGSDCISRREFEEFITRVQKYEESMDDKIRQLEDKIDTIENTYIDDLYSDVKALKTKMFKQIDGIE